MDASSYVSGIKELLHDSAQEIAFSQFKKTFDNNDQSIDERKQVVKDYFRFVGFGIIDLRDVEADGGAVETNSDHYGIAFKSKFGLQGAPVSYFTAGFISGAVEAIYGLSLGSLHAVQTKCIAMGDDLTRFDVKKSENDRSLGESQHEGSYQQYELPQPSDTEVDYSAIRNALTNMPLEGGEATGLIDAFGVLLTRHYANYYSNISYGFLNLFTDQVGGDEIAIAAELLTEAGHVCAFNTFGGIMQSNEWNAMIKPMLSSREDWVHGMTAVVNSLGWGFWEVQELAEDRIVMKITSGYEANSYLGRYKEKPSIPVSFLATGGVAGLMNLIYVLDLPERAPITLDENVYKEISNNSGVFRAKQLKCRAQGDEYDLIEAVRQ